MVERKNRSLEEVTGTLLNETNLMYFWANVVNTACYVLNRVLIETSFEENPIWAFQMKKAKYFSF